MLRIFGTYFGLLIKKQGFYEEENRNIAYRY